MTLALAEAVKNSKNAAERSCNKGDKTIRRYGDKSVLIKTCHLEEQSDVRVASSLKVTQRLHLPMANFRSLRSKVASVQRTRFELIHKPDRANLLIHFFKHIIIKRSNFTPSHHLGGCR